MSFSSRLPLSPLVPLSLSGLNDLLCLGDPERDLDFLFLGDLERERDLEGDCLGFEPDLERDLEGDLFRRGLFDRDRLSRLLGDLELLRRVLRGE